MAVNSVPLSLKLLQDDVDEIFSSLKPTVPAFPLTDQELALELWKAEIAAQDCTISDHELAIKLAESPCADAALISSFLEEEMAAQADRLLALSLDERAAPTNKQAKPLGIEAAQKMVDIILAQKTVSVWGGEASESTSDRNEGTGNKNEIECVVCRETVIYFNAVRAPCRHYYCQRCLTRLFLASVKDESLFPARCCKKVIPLKLVQTLLGPLTSRRVTQRTIEFNDHARKYCSKPTCSAYIFPNQRTIAAHARNAIRKHVCFVQNSSIKAPASKSPVRFWS